jgi:undecaprenyl-diphosphatase
VGSRRAIALILACAAYGAFLWLAAEVSQDRTTAFDAAIRGTVHSWASPRLTSLLRGITLFGSEWFLVPFGGLLCYLFVQQGRRGDAVRLAIASLGAEGLNQILKRFYHRLRPEAFFDYVRPENYSFPSGHAVVSACFYGMLAILLTAHVRGVAGRWAIRAAAGAVMLIIGLTRVYLGVHYPSDVVAGYLLGVVWLGAITAADRRAASPA